LTYAQRTFPGEGEKFCRGAPGFGPEYMSEEQSTERQLVNTRIIKKIQAISH